MRLRLPQWGARREPIYPATPVAPGDPPPGPGDDYLVETETREEETTAAARIIGFVQLVLFAIMAVLTLAVFWIVGLTAGIL